jgi:hypothetical protein
MSSWIQCLRGCFPRPFHSTAAITVILLLPPSMSGDVKLTERQLTHSVGNHHVGDNDNFSPDDRWLVYDTREAEPAIGANAVIAKVNVLTGEERIVYREPGQQPWGPGVGSAGYNPADGSVIIMRGLSSATADRPYDFTRRTGARILSESTLEMLDARDVVPPFTPGALRGGTHRPEWSADGKWIGFTYEDAILTDLAGATGRKLNLRTFGVATSLGRPVTVRPGKENHDGTMFAVIIGRVTPDPRPGSDEIKRAFEDAWVGRNGYRHPDGHWQTRARAFLGTVVDRSGREVVEVFVADIPDRIDVPEAAAPLEGTATGLPNPPRGVTQRRLTHTTERKFPGVTLVPRHWVRSSADGQQIAYLAQDDAGITQVYLVNPQTSAVIQVTRHETPIQSCVRWSPDGTCLAYVCGGAVTVCGAKPGAANFGVSRQLTAPSAQVPDSPVWSNAGNLIAFNRRVLTGEKWCKQVFVVPVALP